MPLQLSYDLTTQPFPLRASPPGGGGGEAVLMVVASNLHADPDRNPVTLRGLSITIMVGPDAADLTADASAVRLVAPVGWVFKEIKKGAGTVEYCFEPNSGNGVVGKQGLPFMLTNITPNTQPGPTTVTIKEGTPGNPTTTRSLAKFPSTWGEVDFWATPSDLPFSAPMTLGWSGPAGATYTINYYDYVQGAEVTIPGQGEPALGNSAVYPGQDEPPLSPIQTTVFTLNVSVTIGEQCYQAQRQKTVTVELPAPKITSFTGRVERTRGQTVLILNWKAEHADYCQLTGDENELTPTSPEGGHGITPSDNTPLRMSYTLTAVSGAGKAEAKLEAVWTEQPISGWPQSDLGAQHDVSLSPDGNTALVCCDNNILVLELTGDSVSVAKSITGIAVPKRSVFLPDGTVFYVLNAVNKGTVQAYSATTFQPIGSPVMGEDYSLLLGSLALWGGAQPRVFVSSGQKHGNVSVFDTSLKLDSQASPVPVDDLPGDMVASPNGRILYVCCFSAGKVQTLDLTTEWFNSTYNWVDEPSGIGISGDGTVVIVAGGDVVQLFNVRENQFVLIGQPIIVPGCAHIAVRGYRAFVTGKERSGAHGTVTIFDLAPAQPVIIGTIKTSPKDASGIAVSDSGLWVLTSPTDGKVLRLQYQPAGATT